MSKWAYYNENNPAAAQWLRNLIKADLIAPGFVDDRSIAEVSPNDMRDFAQHHLFAGLGAWSYSFRNAGWTDDRPVLSLSCPCQSFSAAGERKGFDDKRHLWPTAKKLIEAIRPPVLFGEQVASVDALAWWDLVKGDLKEMEYVSFAADMPAAAFGSPHIRQRLYFVAEDQKNNAT